MVLRGELKSNEQLPSIRLMAKDLKVGIVTVKRAYEELEKEGIIVNIQGRGCFVGEINREKIKVVHIDMLKERLSEIKDFADTSGIRQEEVFGILNEIYGGKGNDK